MRTLYLPLKKEWYEMIERGEKLDEYRGITDYWVRRLLFCRRDLSPWEWDNWIFLMLFPEVRENVFRELDATFKQFDAVCFSYGYTKRRMTFRVKSIMIGRGRREWGAPDHDTFIIKLGERLS